MSLRQAMDRLFEDSFVRRESSVSGDHQLLLDIKAAGNEIVVEAALPGIKPEDVEISVLGDTLTISGSHRDEQSRDEEGYTYREIRRGSFTRTVTLPGNLRTDAATASFDNGMLTLRIPKAEEARPRQIRISGSAEQAGAESPPQPSGQGEGEPA
jgi:HSP20 family protein